MTRQGSKESDNLCPRRVPGMLKGHLPSFSARSTTPHPPGRGHKLRAKDPSGVYITMPRSPGVGRGRLCEASMEVRASGAAGLTEGRAVSARSSTRPGQVGW